MKKIIFLSVVAFLSACGGGSGDNISGVAIPERIEVVK